MPAVNKIDSNTTGTAYAVESALGALSSPVWMRLEPNGFKEFGAEVQTVAPSPINPSRQRKKGAVTDISASLGFNHNLNFFNSADLFESAFFAATRRKGKQTASAVLASPFKYNMASTTGFLVNSIVKGFNFTNPANNGIAVVSAVTANTSITTTTTLTAEASPPAKNFVQVVGYQAALGDIDVDNTQALPALTSTALDFTTLGLVIGQWVFVGGDAAGVKFGTAANNGFKRVRAIATNRLTFDKSVLPMVTEANTTSTIQLFFGDVIKNETDTAIVRKSFTIERTLGAPDSGSPLQIQSENVSGAIVNEMTINIPSADLVNMDVSFSALNSVQRTGAEGPLQTSVQTPTASNALNTSSDFSRIKMALVSSTNPAPSPLFAFITEANISINNNLEANKAVGVIGAFDISAGTFQVGGKLTAYFSDVASMQAVRANADVTLDMIMVKENQGIVIDLPLLTLGDARLSVEKDKAITLPLSMEAATAETIDANLSHTALLTFFAYLPTAAD